MKEPKLGKKIEVKINGNYFGQDIKWTEQLLKTEITKEEKIFFHASDNPISSFKAKETCFYEGYSVRGFIYALTVPIGTEVRYYRGGERRLDLIPGMKIIYIGRIKYDYSVNPIQEKIRRFAQLF